MFLSTRCVKAVVSLWQQNDGSVSTDPVICDECRKMVHNLRASAELDRAAKNNRASASSRSQFENLTPGTAKRRLQDQSRVIRNLTAKNKRLASVYDDLRELEAEMKDVGHVTL